MLVMQPLRRLQCSGMSNIRVSRLNLSTRSLSMMKKCTRHNLFTNHIPKFHSSGINIRFVQTFGSGDKSGGIREKIAHYLTKQAAIYAIWFAGCMVLVFLTASITQKQKYKSSGDHTGHSSIMDADQLEVCAKLYFNSCLYYNLVLSFVYFCYCFILTYFLCFTDEQSLVPWPSADYFKICG